MEQKHAYHAKTKKINAQCHIIRNMVEEKKVLLDKIDNLKDVVGSLSKLIVSPPL